MKKNVLSNAIVSALLSTTVVGPVFAHDILNGSLSGPGAFDFYRTECHGWGTGDYDTTAPAGEVTGAATGLKFALNRYSTSGAHTGVQATIVYVSTGNVNNYSVGNNNVLPASPAPIIITGHNTTNSGTPWPISSVNQPDFTTAGNSPAGWGTADWFPAGEGAYLIQIAQTGSGNGTVGYDFVGHCQNAQSGTVSLIHTGQGTWYEPKAGTAPQLLTPTSDYDQIVDQ